MRGIILREWGGLSTDWQTDRLMDIFDSIVAFATENITTRLLLLLGGKDESKDLNISGPL